MLNDKLDGRAEGAHGNKVDALARKSVFRKAPILSEGGAERLRKSETYLTRDVAQVMYEEVGKKERFKN